MRFARGFILLLALFSAAAAAMLAQRALRTATRPGQPPRLEMVEILVAARAIGVGETVGAEEVRWRAWPKAAVPEGAIRRDNAGDTEAGAPAAFPLPIAPARYALLEGEPLAPAKLIRPEEGSALAVLLSPGMRAVSVPIKDETSAGGFVQPGDRVDVVVARRSGEAVREAARAETVLRGVKVLAIGKALQARAGASGRTATLELTPAHAARLIAAQSGGEIALALIGAGDVEHTASIQSPADEPAPEVRVLKYGRASSRSLQQ